MRSTIQHFIIQKSFSEKSNNNATNVHHPEDHKVKHCMASQGQVLRCVFFLLGRGS